MDSKDQVIALNNTITKTIDKISELNITKGTIYQQILNAYNTRNVRLLVQKIVQVKELINSQEQIYDKLHKKVVELLKIAIEQANIIKKHSTLWYNLITEKNTFLESFENNFVNAIEDLHLHTQTQSALLKTTDKITEFFKIKAELNEAYQSEIQTLFSIQLIYDSSFTAYQSELEQKTKWCINKLAKKNLTPIDVIEIQELSSAVAIMMCIMGILKKNPINNSWINHISNQIDLIAEQLGTHHSRINTGAIAFLMLRRN